VTAPENPEPRIIPPVPITTTFFRTAHGFRWSDLTAEMEAEEASREEKEEAS
jgi:hypothetical protein